MKGESNHVGYSLRGKRRAAEPSPSPSPSTASTDNLSETSSLSTPKSGIAMTRQKKSSINSLGFETLIKDALNKPVEDFRLPNAFLDEKGGELPECKQNSIISSSANGDSLKDEKVGESFEEVTDQDGIHDLNHSLASSHSENDSLPLPKMSKLENSNVITTCISECESKDSDTNSTQPSSTIVTDHTYENQTTNGTEALTTSNSFFKEIIDNSSLSSVRQSLENEDSSTLSKNGVQLDQKSMSSFTELIAERNSKVEEMYTFPEDSSCETQFIVLIQSDCVSLWWRELEKSPTRWTLSSYSLNDNKEFLSSSSTETAHHIWILLLYMGEKDLILVHLRYDKNDKIINISLKEFFSLYENFSVNLATIASLNGEKSVVTVPGSEGKNIDLFLFDLPTSSKTKLTTMKDDYSVQIFPIKDWEGSLFTRLGNEILIWDLTDRSVVSAIPDLTILKYTTVIDVLYDKGLVYLFLGHDPLLSNKAIEVVALNPRTKKYASILTCNLDAKLIPLSFYRWSRQGNIVILLTSYKVILHDLVENKTFHRSTHTNNSLRCVSLGTVSENAVILAAHEKGKIFNLFASRGDNFLKIGEHMNSGCS